MSEPTANRRRRQQKPHDQRASFAEPTGKDKASLLVIAPLCVLAGLAVGLVIGILIAKKPSMPPLPSEQIAELEKRIEQVDTERKQLQADLKFAENEVIQAEIRAEEANRQIVKSAELHDGKTVGFSPKTVGAVRVPDEIRKRVYEWDTRWKELKDYPAIETDWFAETEAGGFADPKTEEVEGWFVLDMSSDLQKQMGQKTEESLQFSRSMMKNVTGDEQPEVRGPMLLFYEDMIHLQFMRNNSKKPEFRFVFDRSGEWLLRVNVVVGDNVIYSVDGKKMADSFGIDDNKKWQGLPLLIARVVKMQVTDADLD